MRWFAIAAVIALTACGGGSNNDAIIIEPDPPDAVCHCGCNPLIQTGCNAGEKCTWITDQDDPPIGHVGCAPAGDIPPGEPCTEPLAGPTGFDDCEPGTACMGGQCKPICDVNGGFPTCDQNHACSRYADFFESGGTAIAGVCEPACDPLTQELHVGSNTTACGSLSPSMPDKGCFGIEAYSCAPSSSATWALTDRKVPRTNATGNPYLNGCAPGFIPLFFEMTGSTKTLCTGFCAALEIDNTKPILNAKGDATASGKLPTQAAPVANAGNATCNADKKGSEDSSQCHFLWPYLRDDSTGELPAWFEQSRYRDTLGVCFAIAHFMYDSDNNTTPDAPVPDCTTLPPRSSATVGMYDDAADWGCQLRASSQLTTSGAALNPALANIRLPKQLALELVRHELQ